MVPPLAEWILVSLDRGFLTLVRTSTSIRKPRQKVAGFAAFDSLFGLTRSRTARVAPQFTISLIARIMVSQSKGHDYDRLSRPRGPRGGQRETTIL